MTNFMTVQNAPEKQWVDDVNLTVLSIGTVKEGKFGFEQEIQVKDETGHESPFKVQSKYEDGMMDIIDVGLTQPFRCKWWNAKSGAQVGGYCTRAAQKPPQRSTGGTPGFGAKMPASAPLNQRKPAFGGKERDYDKENRGKCRFGFLQALVQNGMKPKGFVAAASMISHTSRSRRLHINAISFTSAMLTLRKVFSRSLTISAVRLEETSTTVSMACS